MEVLNVDQWRFIKADTKDAWKKDYDDATWKEVSVPHDWSVLYPFDRSYSSGTGYLAGGIGWYRTVIDLRQITNLEDKVLKLFFEGIYKNSHVWVNGYHLASRPSGYASFYVDVSEIAKYSHDQQMVVSVRVERNDLADSRWYNGTGINKKVTLEIHEKVYVDDFGTFFTTKSLGNQEAQIEISHILKNETSQMVTVQVENELISLQKDSSYRFSKEVQIEAYSSYTEFFTYKVINPELWSPEQPNLYQLKTHLKYQTAEADKNSTYCSLVGIRDFSFHSDSGFTLNGDSLKLKGVCLHEDAGCFGTAVPTLVWARRLLKLKEMGANAVRMAHNPHSSELYSLCDLLGFLVIDEAFDEWENPKNKWWQGHNIYPPKLDGYAEYFPNWYKKDLENMVLQNKNHPSIIAWSIGNEIDYPNDPYANERFNMMTGNNDNNKPKEERIYNPNRPNTARLTTIANTLAGIVKSVDSTRPVTLAAAFPELSVETGLIENIDLVGYNYKEFLYEEHHKRFPDKPFLGSENGHGYNEWLACRDKVYIAGQFLWTGIDYLGEAHGWPIHGSGAGHLTLAGLEKSNFYLRKSWWNAEPMVYLETYPYTDEEQPHYFIPGFRKWDYPLGQTVEVRCYTNSDDVQLYVGEHPVSGLTFDEEKGYYHTTLPYEEAELSVIASFSSGQVKDRLQPTGLPAEMDASCVNFDPKMLKKMEASGISFDSSTVQVEIQLQDRFHRNVQADLLLQVEVEGGQLLGLENGDLADITAYTENYRRTLNGKLVVFVKKKNKEVKVVVNAAGIPRYVYTLPVEE